jgi:hypothetical protein
VAMTLDFLEVGNESNIKMIGLIKILINNQLERI